jgi:hypothetical protein
MGGSRGILIGFNPGAPELFVRLSLESGSRLPPNRYSEIGLEIRRLDDSEYLEIHTTAKHLFREFHRLAGLLTEEYERKGQTATGAFLVVADRWRELTTTRNLLSPEEQLGLLGELIVLGSLIYHHGPNAVSSWTGRLQTMPERHDFRFASVDLEVKSTRTSRRAHIIHGLRQLQPSAGHDLFLISFCFEAAGLSNGWSLVDKVKAIRSSLSQSEQALAEFNNKLQTTRYLDVDEPHYKQRLIMADVPVLVPVDTNCPRIISTTLKEAIGLTLASRIGNDVTYRIDVEGLGEPLTTSITAHLLGLSPWE